jgi:small subunit ribosomal protein S8
MTDPIADMLTRIRNAQAAGHTSVSMPSSRIKTDIARILKDEGYVATFTVEPATPAARLTIALKYGSGGEGVITGIERVSKPGRRVYCGSEDIPTVLGGLGTAIVSTSRGLLSGRESRRQRVGGELICQVW